MAYIPYAPQKGAPYTITGPTGVVAVLNDTTSSDYVGMISDITGLDSPDIRESAEDLVQADGGQHGYFYFGRRPIVITVQVFGHADALTRDTRLDKIARATNAMKADAILSWTNQPSASYLPMQTWVRRQQPIRVSGGWTKEVQIPLVSQYAPLFGQTLRTSAGAGPLVVENRGSYPAYPVVRVTAVTTSVNPTIAVTGVGGGTLITTGLTITAGNWVEFDMLNHTAVDQAGASQNSKVDWGNTATWPYLATGNNTITLTGGGTMTVTWRDTWL